ncbi:MAG: metal-dependent hydrolase [Candidatus Competibacteraceae bacterium]|nr:metal-dependent hydrolase [Candidatus Competibacteraceae bacterium]
MAVKKVLYFNLLAGIVFFNPTVYDLIPICFKPIVAAKGPHYLDIITQGIAGAVVAQGASRKPHWRTATLIGLLAGLLPDADILINSAEDPLLRLEYHRQFSHALAFIPVGALLITLVMWPVVCRRLDFRHIYIYSLLGISMGGLLDACTSFGTHLFWPFSDARTAWNLIAVVDPLFTLFLIVPLVLGWQSRERRYPLLAAALASTYLLFGYSQTRPSVMHSRRWRNNGGIRPPWLLSNQPSVIPCFGEVSTGTMISTSWMRFMLIHSGTFASTPVNPSPPFYQPMSMHCRKHMRLTGNIFHDSAGFPAAIWSCTRRTAMSSVTYVMPYCPQVPSHFGAFALILKTQARELKKPPSDS